MCNGKQNLRDPLRPSVLAANTCYLLCAAGLALLTYFSRDIIDFMRSLFGNPSNMTVNLIVNGVFYIAFALAPVIVIAAKRGSEAIRLNEIRPTTAIMIAVMAILCVPLAEYIGALWMLLLEAVGAKIPDTSIYIENSGEMTLAVFALGVLPGICEEMVFRGAMLGAYEHGGTRRAVIISSVLFMSLHASVAGAPTEFLLGMVMGMLVLWTDSLYASMIFHTFYNSVLVMLSYVMKDAEITTEAPTLFENVNGWSGIGLMVFGVFVLGAVVVFLMNRIRKKCDYEPVPRGKIKWSAAGIIALALAVLIVCSQYVFDIIELLGY